MVKTLVMQDQDARPLLVLMHGNRKVSTKKSGAPDWRQIGRTLRPEVANRHSGYLVAAPRLWYAPGHAGVHRSDDPDPAQKS